VTVGAIPAPGAVPARPSTPEAAAATRAAASFERMLLEQLTTQLAATAVPEDDEGSAATSAIRDMPPGAMAEALSGAGGIGIAAQLQAATAAASPSATAPSAAPTTGAAATPATGAATRTSSPAPTGTTA
jgi:Rod binding domain-containing protein